MTVRLDDTVVELSRHRAARLRERLGIALSRSREFAHTVAERRPDGRYVVRRRRAESSGHAKVFESFEALVTLYDDLPREFTAEALTRDGMTGGRRHLVLRHLVEHPAFDCALVARQPLTARKGSPTREGPTLPGPR
ncbi:MAG: hypothetical protein ABEJ08_04440 [Halobacteriaceae archaeon]